MHRLLVNLGLSDTVPFDAETVGRFDVDIGRTTRVAFETDIPWYLVQKEEDRTLYGLDSHIYGTFHGRRLTVEGYDIGFMDHRLRTDKTSVIRLDDNDTLVVERLALLDTAKIFGHYSLSTKRGTFKLEGRDTHYSGPEGNVTFDSDVNVTLTERQLRIEGEIPVKKALITYQPPKTHTIEDPDIVIVQHVKEPSHTQTTINLRIFSDTPLRYRTDIADIRFKPDVTVWKEPQNPLGLLGIVKVPGGSADIADKHFFVEPSEIYFAGSWPIDPWLNIHVRYELDFRRFFIYVGHRLASPVFLFSSEPPMSQNDIMSYILFGAPADQSFDTDENSDKTVGTMLMGYGLKNMLGATLGIHFDSLNILKTDNGGYGFEIGTKLAKNIRLLYRNDTLSSIILQYRLSRSLRLDVDVKSSGQGVNILYIKDFRGPKRLNERWGR